MLENPEDPDSRCCLGHTCAALGAHREQCPEGVLRIYYVGDADHDRSVASLPMGIAKKMGMDTTGSFRKPITIPIDRRRPDVDVSPENGLTKRDGQTFLLIESLVQLNDDTTLTPQEIGEVMRRERNNFLELNECRRAV